VGIDRYGVRAAKAELYLMSLPTVRVPMGIFFQQFTPGNAVNAAFM
jgi:hypothetical protein